MCRPWRGCSGAAKVASGSMIAESGARGEWEGAVGANRDAGEWARSQCSFNLLLPTQMHRAKVSRQAALRRDMRAQGTLNSPGGGSLWARRLVGGCVRAALRLRRAGGWDGQRWRVRGGSGLHLLRVGRYNSILTLWAGRFLGGRERVAFARGAGSFRWSRGAGGGSGGTTWGARDASIVSA